MRTGNWSFGDMATALPDRTVRPKTPRPAPMTDAQIEEAKHLYLGMTLSTYAVARQMGLQQETVRASLKKAGVTMRGKVDAQHTSDKRTAK